MGFWIPGATSCLDHQEGGATQFSSHVQFVCKSVKKQINSLKLNTPRRMSKIHLHSPSGSILSSEICLSPGESTRNRSNGLVPAATQKTGDSA